MAYSGGTLCSGSRTIFEFLHKFKAQSYFQLIYSAGLRVRELLNLKISDIDSDRMQIRIKEGKGQEDISATQIYTHVSSRTLKDVKTPIEKLNM